MAWRLTLALLAAMALPVVGRTLAFGGPDDRDAGVLRAEFIFQESPTPFVHASTLVETRSGLVAAWFGGSSEGASDTRIWLSRRVGGVWSVPVDVAAGTERDGKTFPCWNPVLFQASAEELLLFSKVGPGPSAWWGVVRTSRDGGITWSEARRFPDGVLGPSKNKPVRLKEGEFISPSSIESGDRWRIHFELTADGGRTWAVVVPESRPGQEVINAIQPAILIHPGGRLEALGRTRQGRVFETWSGDGGRTWGPVRLTPLPNPSSGLDAVTLRDGRHLLVYNHTAAGRSPLNVSMSTDGETWQAAALLESGPGEYSYPAVIQTSDGLVHITYTWQRRRIKHVVLDPAQLVLRAMPGARWPPLV